jgi:hypothetical protein
MIHHEPGETVAMQPISNPKIVAIAFILDKAQQRGPRSVAIYRAERP